MIYLRCPKITTYNTDIVVYGDTAGAVAAAVAASRAGKTVSLVAPKMHAGGLMISGLGETDVSAPDLIGGISRELFKNNRTYYNDSTKWLYPQGGNTQAEEMADYFSGRGVTGQDVLWQFEPRVTKQLFKDLLAATSVQVFYSTRMDRSSVVTSNGKIQSFDTLAGDTFEADFFIDAGYEGDLMEAAGVSYRIGRESAAEYGEEFAGVYTDETGAPFVVQPFNGWVDGVAPESGTIFGVEPALVGADGDGDQRTQTYNYRLTLTEEGANQKAFTKSANYDAANFEMYRRAHAAGNSATPFSTTSVMPNRKTDSNGASIISTDFVGQNYDYPNGTYAERDAIEDAHWDFILDLTWSVENDTNWGKFWTGWGFANDEYADNGGRPYGMYVRESRRMISDYVITELDAKLLRVANDPVCFATYEVDSHFVSRYVDETGTVRGEGSFFDHTKPFRMSYRALKPAVGEVNNLFVSAAVSASHVAYGAIRMEPTYMMLGEICALAAVQAINTTTTAHTLDYLMLKDSIEARGINTGYLGEATMTGTTVVENTGSTYTGIGSLNAAIDATKTLDFSGAEVVMRFSGTDTVPPTIAAVDYPDGLKIYAAGNDRANGKGGGAFINEKLTITNNASGTVNLEGLRIKQIGFGKVSTVNGLNCDVGALIDDANTVVVYEGAGGKLGAWENCIFRDGLDGFSSNANSGEGALTLSRCSAVDGTARGIVRGTPTDCLVLNAVGLDYQANEGGSYNASSDGTAPGTGAQTATADDLVDYAAGNFNLAEDSPLRTLGSTGGPIGADLFYTVTIAKVRVSGGLTRSLTG